MGKKRKKEGNQKRERVNAIMVQQGYVGKGEKGCNPLKDRNISGERYLAPPNGQICKLVSGVSLYSKTPRLEGRGG